MAGRAAIDTAYGRPAARQLSRGAAMLMSERSAAGELPRRGSAHASAQAIEPASAQGGARLGEGEGEKPAYLLGVVPLHAVLCYHH
jgi:hypothetical protein